MSRSGLRVVEDGRALAAAAARSWLDAALDAVAARRRFVVVLAGGSTPRALYETLAAEPFASSLPWSSTVVLFGDERQVGPDHAESNYRMAREALLARVPIPAEQIHRMHGELADPRAAAAAYERTLRSIFRGETWPRSDLALLGLGEDGHTASLFPGTAALEEREHWVVANEVPRLSTWRITLTLPALNAARQILFLVSGASKATVAAEAFGGAPHSGGHPAELVVPFDGTRTVLLDRAAARGLRVAG